MLSLSYQFSFKSFVFAIYESLLKTGFTVCMVNVLKFLTLFTFCSQFRAKINKMLVRIAIREDHDQTASSEGV